MQRRRIPLTTVAGLIRELSKLPSDSKVFVDGTCGYMHIWKDKNGIEVSFDDDALSEFYDEDE